MDFIAWLRAEGMSAPVAAAKAATFTQLQAAWSGWAEQEPQRAHFVPGRVELLGKHTDYAGGRSLLCTIERGFCVLSRARRDQQIRLLDAGRGEVAEFAAGGEGETKWSHYPAVVARRLVSDEFLRRGADIVFLSDLPAAAGISSSSAFVVASFLGLQVDHSWSSREELAGYLAAAEVGVGTHGGSEDHTAILCCQAGTWSQYRFRPVCGEDRVSAPTGLSLVIGVSGVAADKAGAALADYNRAADSAAAIVSTWNRATGRQDEHLAAVLHSAPDAPLQLRRVLAGQVGALARCEQFWNECEAWVPQAVAAARGGDWASFGECVARSQAGAEAALGNQIAETRFLVASARKLGAVAASGFGAGFGGSVWALAPRTQAEGFRQKWQHAYAQQFAAHAGASLFFESAAGPGARSFDMRDGGNSGQVESA